MGFSMQDIRVSRLSNIHNPFHLLPSQDALQYESFIGPERKLEQGNVEEAFQCADQILEGKFFCGRQGHCKEGLRQGLTM
jgi:hypothetical protein